MFKFKRPMEGKPDWHPDPQKFTFRTKREPVLKPTPAGVRLPGSEIAFRAQNEQLHIWEPGGTSVHTGLARGQAWAGDTAYCLIAVRPWASHLPSRSLNSLPLCKRSGHPDPTSALCVTCDVTLEVQIRRKPKLDAQGKM